MLLLSAVSPLRKCIQVPRSTLLPIRLSRRPLDGLFPATNVFVAENPENITVSVLMLLDPWLKVIRRSSIKLPHFRSVYNKTRHL